MKLMYLAILFIGLLFLCSCTLFYGKQTGPDSVVKAPKPLVLPIGKSWQVIEEAPKLSDERGHLPFQTEQSLQPEGAKTVAPTEDRTVEMPR